MRPFLSVLIGKGNQQPIFNGQEFVTAKVSAEQAEKLESAVRAVSAQEKKASSPQFLRILSMALLTIALMCFAAILIAETPLTETYANAPWVFYAGGGFFLAWIGLAFFEQRKQKSVRESQATKDIKAGAKQETLNCYAELGVPEDAASIDLLMFRYTIKNDSIQPKSYGPSAYYACNGRIFLENDALCIADADQRYEIPLSTLQYIETVERDIAIPGWNKETPIKQPPYDQYHIWMDKNGFAHFKPYYILHFEYRGEDWGLYFPCYELPTIENLTGLQG